MVILTPILFLACIGIQNSNSQVTDSAFASCVMMSAGYTIDVVMLGTDDDCNGDQFAQAVAHYKAQGYRERQYSNMFGEQIMSLEK